MSSVNFEQIFTYCFSLFIVNFEHFKHIIHIQNFNPVF